jgi:peptidoglycan hydrolase-like protein with peptidoglycan-binding domain
MEKNKSNTGKEKGKSNKKTYVVLGITLGTLSLAGLGYWYFKGRKGAKVENTDSDLFQQVANESSSTTSASHTYSSAPKTSMSNTGFPIKFNSKGELVKQIQNELIKKYGEQILPKYGADGHYGKELEAALTSKGFSKTIDFAKFNKILALNTTSSTPAAAIPPSSSTTNKIDIAKNIWLHTTYKNLQKLLEQLKRIKNVEEYKGVNDLFKTIRLFGVRQTIVNGTLNNFSDDTSKQLIRQEFIRMGLKYDGSKWSLSGVYSRQLITKSPTTIRSSSNAELHVPENTLLGVEIESIGGLTKFKTINHELLTVPTKHIQYV